MTAFLAYLVLVAGVCALYVLQPPLWVVFFIVWVTFPAAVILLPTRERGD